MTKTNPTKKNKYKEKYKSLYRARSGKFEKSEKLNLKCRFCGSNSIVKFGYNITKKGKKARYKCKDCNAKFTPTSKLVAN